MAMNLEPGRSFDRRATRAALTARCNITEPPTQGPLDEANLERAWIDGPIVHSGRCRIQHREAARRQEEHGLTMVADESLVKLECGAIDIRPGYRLTVTDAFNRDLIGAVYEIVRVPSRSSSPTTTLVVKRWTAQDSQRVTQQ